jgi:hypothetical protein
VLVSEVFELGPCQIETAPQQLGHADGWLPCVGLREGNSNTSSSIRRFEREPTAHRDRGDQPFSDQTAQQRVVGRIPDRKIRKGNASLRRYPLSRSLRREVRFDRFAERMREAWEQKAAEVLET